MKRALTLLVALCTGAAFAAIDFSGVTALADRLGGTALTSKVTFTEWEGQSGDKAQIIPGDGAFTIKATSVHAASLALGTYLRDVAKGHISWCGKRMPTDWALPTATIDVAPRYPHAMAYNYCTLSYTMAYWSKEAWQNEIDRLALSGYTTALCMAGVQKIWKLTMEELGYTKQQQQDFIVDDAQQAWWLMGNLQAQGNATPQGHFPIVSDDEIETDADVGKFIVAKMREVGIEPVLQGFIGLVPSSTTKTQLVTYLNNHPDVCTKYGITDTSAAVKIFVTGSYNEGHKSPDLVDPNCTMFQVFSDVWNKNLKAAYGMDDEKDYPKFLGGDLFHENSPPSSMTETEKNNCAKFVQKYQQDAFPGVTWVLQNWQSAPVQDLRNGLDPDHTIIQRLDQSMNATDARTASYVNYKMSPAGNIPWVWVEVMNFGGNTGMHGAFRRFRNVGNLGGNASFKGYGLLSEGLETNPISYDMYHWAMVQSTQDKQNIDDDELEPWMEAYRQRRYGYTDDNLKAAYTILANTVWTCKQDQQGTMESVFCAKPAYNVTKVSAWGPTTGTPYDRKELIIAAEYFLETAKANPELLDLETFRYDFVEIFQQILADKAREMIPDCATSQKRRDEFRQMLELVDRILACSDEWRLDAKENRLKGKAPTTGPSAYRRLITTWTPGGRHQTQLSQYAHRSYAGLVKNYYAKKWNAFFDVTEGTMSQAAYNTLCDTLDEEFPTTELPATPTDGDPVAIAEEILALIAPPAITWTGATDNVWEHANWNDAKGQAAEWENGKSVILSGMNKTITTAGMITVGNIALENAAVNADNQGWIDPTTAIVIAANTTIEDAHTWDYAGIMSGGWFGSPVQRQCAATGFHKSDITTTDNVKSFTIQFQAIDFSDNVNWLKAVSAKIYQDGADVKIVSTGTGVQNGGTLGSGPLSGGSAPASSSGYCIKQIVTHRPSVVTITGSVAVEGEITLNDGEALALPGATAIDTISLEKGTATLGLGATQDLAINVMLLGSDAKLVLTGSAPTLMGAAGSTKVKLPKSALSKIVYVGPDGEEQSLRLDTEGYLKAEFKATTISQWIPKSAISTGIKGLSLAELAEKGILSAKMDGGYVPTSDVSAYCGKLSDDGLTYTVQMQTIDNGFLKVVALEFTVVDGELKVEAKWIRNRNGDPLGTDCTNLSNYTNYGNPDVVTDTSSNGYGIYNLKITPAVARFSDGTKFASLTDALTAANGTQKVTLLDDVTVMTAINNNFKTWLEIPRGITLTATCGDFIWWDKAYTLDIYGTLDLGGNALSVGTTKSHVINLYADGEIKSTNAKGLAIFAANTTINVKANDGFDTATLNTPVQARENTTIAVEEGVTAVLNGNIVLKGGGESGTATPVVTKTGAGTLEFNGVITTGATLVLSEGTLKRVMPVGDTLVVTVNGGTTDITEDNADAKVVETIDGAVHTFTCIERPYRYRVTDPGEISVNMPGTNYETLAEALDAAKALQDANPGKVVNVWAISQEVEAQVQADLAAWNAANGTSMTLFGDGNGIVVKDWNKAPEEPREYNLTAFEENWWDTDDSGSIYVGPAAKDGDAKWDVAANWMKTTKDGVGDRRTGGANDYAPYALGNPYNYALIDGDNIDNVTPDGEGVYHLTADKLDFWRVRLGLTNNVDVTITEVTKMQKGASAFIYVDPTSKLTIKKVTSWKGDTIDLHSAAPEGIVFEGMNGNVWNFYLEGEGTVQFNCQLSGSSHQIKSAEIEIGEGECTEVKTKKLIGFTSLASGAAVTLADDALVDTTESGVTLTKVEKVTSESAAGSYALRQGTDGFYLDYVARRPPRHLTWNYAKTYWESTSGTDGNGNRGKAYLGDDLVVIEDADIVEFPESTSGCIYINKDLSPKMLIKRGATVTLGKADLVSNVPTGAEIEIEEGGVLKLSHWQGNSASVIKDCKITGAGKIMIDETKSVSLELGNVEGDITIEVGNNYPIIINGVVGSTISGSATISGSGTVKAFSGMTLDNAWTGTVLLPTSIDSWTNIGQYGNATSTIKFTSDFSGWFSQDCTISGDLDLDGHTITLSNGFGAHPYVINRLVGSGTINSTWSTKQPITINEVLDADGNIAFTGTLTGYLTVTLPTGFKLDSDGRIIHAGAPAPTEGQTFPAGIVITDENGVTYEQTIPDTTGIYTVSGGSYESDAKYAVIAAKEADESETPAKTTTAVAVAFDGMTVATLLNNSLLDEGDTLTAYVEGTYWMWTLNGTKLWDSATMVRAGGSGTAPSAAKTTLTRGTAVWVTTAGKIVTFGKYTEPTAIVMPTTEETHLLANPTMEPYTPPVEEVENDDDVVTIEETPVRYTKVGGKWTKLTPSEVTLPGFSKPVNVRVDANPSIPVGKAFWFIKK